jgi:hypothetical protein
VQVTILDHIEKSCRVFLWNDKNIQKHGKCLAKWEDISLPKKNGGLGVLNLRIQNQALIIKFLYKFFNRQDIPWVQLIWKAHYNDERIPHEKAVKGSFWWRDCTAFIDTFKMIAKCKVRSGNTIMLWNDIWKEDAMRTTFPQLHSFAKNKDISVSNAIQQNTEDLYQLFHLPLSAIAMQQCNTLNINLTDLAGNTEKDIWGFQWGDFFSAKKVYEAILNPPEAAVPFRWIWKSCCLPKHKFFFWLLLMDRLNTKDLMTRKHFYVESTDCVLCQNDLYEDMIHLFFQCDFSQTFWWRLGMEWDTDLSLIDMLIDGKQRNNSIYFKEAMIIGCWTIWIHRNKFIFDNAPICQDRCFAMFRESFALIMYRAKPSLKDGMQQWLDTL